jgi:hypothetical protein
MVFPLENSREPLNCLSFDGFRYQQGLQQLGVVDPRLPGELRCGSDQPCLLPHPRLSRKGQRIEHLILQRENIAWLHDVNRHIRELLRSLK